jgi:tRNA(fMet)-specific endonuclease VapC
MAERKVMYLLDTNTISEPFRVNPNETVVRRLRDCSEACAISSITWHELHYGLRASLQLKGNVRPILDFQIAAIALSRDLTLVTRNVADFSGIANLRLENWFC